MNFPRYFDVTLDGERYPTLIEVATDHELELWDPDGWDWERHSRPIVFYSRRLGRWIAAGFSAVATMVVVSSDADGNWDWTPVSPY